MTILVLLTLLSAASAQDYFSILDYTLPEEGIKLLSTEASLLSHSLLIRRGWVEKAIETIEIAGISFDRYRMFKRLYSKC